jgi:2-phosphosulfolactate phosphatase
MHIDAVLTPAEIALLPKRDLSTTTCVVFDVLRATSSMITALACGATEIYPVRTIAEARALKKRMPDAILGGERHGDLIPGFDIGNSPLEYRQAVAGRRIISTTTNGTVALRACGEAQRVLVGALLNLDALATALRGSASVLFVCAGTFDTFALEDAYAASVLMKSFNGPVQATDAAKAIAALAQHFTVKDTVKNSRNGQALANAGRSADVKWCAQLSKYNVVGLMEAAVIRPLPA